MTYNYISRSLSSKDHGAHFDVIVIGTGYGGGVAASRLARVQTKTKGRLSVAVLERGREIAPGDYPRDLNGVQKDLQITLSGSGTTLAGGSEHKGPTDALYDLRLQNEVNVLLGCGLGGTSLINANVAVEPDPRVYASWPGALKGGAILEDYFNIARNTLGSTPYPAGRDLPKLSMLENVAKGLKKEDAFRRPEINVTFKDRHNDAGIFQPACTKCGDCCTGCNYGSKNTVLMNYLPDAKRHHADILTHADVVAIEKGRGDKRWKVETRDPRDHTTKAVLTAKYIILGAGTLGTTEILLRSRERGLSLSPRLGKGFSNNGDVWAFGYNANMTDCGDAAPRPPVYSVGAGMHDVVVGKTDNPAHQPGPCITGSIHLNDPLKLENSMLLEEGVIPGAFAPILAAGFPIMEALKGDPFRFGDAPLRAEDAEKLGDAIKEDPLRLGETVYEGPMSRSAMFLVMGHDEAIGEMKLRKDRVIVKWKDGGKDPSILRIEKTVRKACDAIQAEYLANPLWMDEFGHRLMCVHPLGGCGLGASGEEGVINDKCQVYSGLKSAVHPGLYVCDGSALPVSLGANPHLTITALAEYAMQTLADDNEWTINRMSNPPLGLPTVEDEGELDLEKLYADAMTAVTAIKSAIDNKMWELARNLLLGVWRQYGPEGKKKEVAFRINFCRETPLQTRTSPIIDKLHGILAPIGDMLAEKDYIGILEHLEATKDDAPGLGDFSPAALLPELMTGYVSSAGLDDEASDSEFDPYLLAPEKPENVCTLQGDIRSDSVRMALTPEIETFREPWIDKGIFTFRGKTYDIADGKFEFLQPVPEDIEHWKIAYTGRLKGTNLSFHGFKTLKRREGSNFWADVSDLRIDIKRGDKSIARGMIRVSFEEAFRQFQSVKVEYQGLEKSAADFLDELTDNVVFHPSKVKEDFDRAEYRAQLVKTILYQLSKDGDSDTPVKKVEALYSARLVGRMGELILRTYGEIGAYLANFPYKAMPEPPGWPDDLPEPEVYWPEPEPDVFCKLTRFNGRLNSDKRRPYPIMLAGGFGTRVSSLGTPTVENNIVQMLYRDGYDVWMFDYRGSGEIEASTKPFTIDDVAEKDWPEAISLVLRLTGAKQVKALVHCVGSLSLFMAVLRGERRVKNILASQLGPHLITNWYKFAQNDSGIAEMIVDGVPNAMKPVIDFMKLPPELAKMAEDGIPVLDPRSPSGPHIPEGLDPILDTMVWKTPNFAPVQCYSPTCHRINFIFGPTFLHDNLNQDTHNAIHHFFGPVASKPFLHLGKIFEQGHVVSWDGSFDYMAGVKNLDIPIHFIHGARNQEILPEATLRSMKWLKDENGALKYSRHVFPMFGHMDSFVGRDAHNKIFPHILDMLDKLDRRK